MVTKISYAILLAMLNLVMSENESDNNVRDPSDLGALLDVDVEGRGLKKYIPLIASIIHAMVTKFIVVKIFFGVIIVALYYKFFHALGWLKWWLLKEYKAKECVIHHDHDHDWHGHDHDWHGHDHGWQYGQNDHYRQDNKASGPYYYKDKPEYSTLPDRASNIPRSRRSTTQPRNNDLTLTRILDFQREK